MTNTGHEQYTVQNKSSLLEEADCVTKNQPLAKIDLLAKYGGLRRLSQEKKDCAKLPTRTFNHFSYTQTSKCKKIEIGEDVKNVDGSKKFSLGRLKPPKIDSEPKEALSDRVLPKLSLEEFTKGESSSERLLRGIRNLRNRSTSSNQHIPTLHKAALSQPKPKATSKESNSGSTARAGTISFENLRRELISAAIKKREQSSEIPPSRKNQSLS